LVRVEELGGTDNARGYGVLSNVALISCCRRVIQDYVPVTVEGGCVVGHDRNTRVQHLQGGLGQRWRIEGTRETVWFRRGDGSPLVQHAGNIPRRVGSYVDTFAIQSCASIEKALRHRGPEGLTLRCAPAHIEGVLWRSA